MPSGLDPMNNHAAIAGLICMVNSVAYQSTDDAFIDDQDQTGK